MKIQRLYIGDFGILRNQILDDINPGIVVIGGLNRAGKSTFMQVLRYLGYGFPQGRGLPPASNKYEAEADIRLDAGDVYNLRLMGHSQPVLKRISGNQEHIVSTEELYGLDDFTYGQLFTITLDELNRDPRMSNDDRRRLQSILLGAGFSDMLLIPQLEEDFYREGEKIGGKRGSPKVKQFKPYYNAIEKGQRLKQRGLSQVGEYQEKQKELREKEDIIYRLNKSIQQLNCRVVQLDVIKNNYESYLKLEELGAELKYKGIYSWKIDPSKYDLDRIKDLRKNYISLDRDLKDKEIELGIPRSVREELLDKKEELTSYRTGISGILERIRQLGQRRQEYNRKKQDLASRIRDTNSLWGEGDIQAIAAIKTDKIEYNRLSELVESYKELENRHRSYLENQSRSKEEYEAFRAQAIDLGEDKPWLGVRKYFYLSLALVVLGIISSLIKPLFGIFIGLGGIMGAAVYVIIKSLHSKVSQEAVNNQNERLNGLKARIRTEENGIKDLEIQLNKKREKLDNCKEELGLSTGAPHGVLPEHLSRIKDIQDRIMELDELSQDLNRESTYLEGQYNSYMKFIGQFSWDDRNYSDRNYSDRNNTNNDNDHEKYGKGHRDEDWDEILSRLDLWEDYLISAQEIKIIQEKKEALRQEIISIMEKYERVGSSYDRDGFEQETGDNFGYRDKGDLQSEIADFIDKGEKAIEFAQIQKDFDRVSKSIMNAMGSDAIRKAFNAYGDLLSIFKEKCSDYTSLEEVQEDYERISRKRNEELDELEELKEIRQELKGELHRLATVENLVEGQRQIDNARSELKILAHEYAINMTAAFLLNEAGQSLLQGMKDSIMDSAGNIFSRMTNGHYKGIIPSEPLLEADFEAILHEKSSSQTIDMLSRGTREQLYLSVRLSRIMEIKPNLPIIIDDSFANFDSLHLEQSIGILTDLSRTHQIFILTCHGELIEEIARLGSKAQYWKLDQGKLEASDWEGLSSYLGSFNLSKDA